LNIGIISAGDLLGIDKKQDCYISSQMSLAMLETWM